MYMNRCVRDKNNDDDVGICVKSATFTIRFIKHVESNLCLSDRKGSRMKSSISVAVEWRLTLSYTMF